MVILLDLEREHDAPVERGVIPEVFRTCAFDDRSSQLVHSNGGCACACYGPNADEPGVGISPRFDYVNGYKTHPFYSPWLVASHEHRRVDPSLREG